jgi:hypothetical protein
MRDDELVPFALTIISLFVFVFMIFGIFSISQESLIPFPCIGGTVGFGVLSLIFIMNYYKLIKTPVCQTCGNRMTYIEWYQQYFCNYCGTYNQLIS